MRVFLFSLVPFLLIGLVAFLIFGLRPPDSIRLAAGIDGGGYWQIGQLYKTRLARDGIRVELIETEGSVENIELLAAGKVDAAFVDEAHSELKNLESKTYAALQKLETPRRICLSGSRCHRVVPFR